MTDHPMEQEAVELQPVDTTEVPACAGCGTPVAEPFTHVPLCTSCHTYFQKYPFPKWIKVFGGAVLLVLVFALLQFPRNISTGVHFKRAREAARQHRYVTAQKELQAVVRSEPGFIEARARLMEAAFYNNDFATLSASYGVLQHKTMEASLQADLDQTFAHLSNYYPTDSFSTLLGGYHNDLGVVPEPVFDQYTRDFPEDGYAAINYASALMERKESPKADSLLSKVLAVDPAFYPALSLKLSLKREILQLDSAYYYAGRLLQLNAEDCYALSAKARTLLKQKRDAESLSVARQANAINPKDGYTLATLAMIYHFTGDGKNFKDVMARASADTANKGYLQYVNDLTSGKEFFRN